MTSTTVRRVDACNQELVRRIKVPLWQTEALTNVEYGTDTPGDVDRAEHDGRRLGQRGDLNGPHDTLDAMQGQCVAARVQGKHHPLSDPVQPPLPLCRDTCAVMPSEYAGRVGSSRAVCAYRSFAAGDRCARHQPFRRRGPGS